MSIWADYNGRCGDCGYRIRAGKCNCRMDASVKPWWDTRLESALEQWLDDPVYHRKPEDISERDPSKVVR